MSRADVRRDAVQPRSQRGTALEAVACPRQRAHEGLLDGVLGVERRTEHPVAVAGQLSAVLLEALGDGPVPMPAPAPVPRTVRVLAEGRASEILDIGDGRVFEALQGRRQARAGGRDHGHARAHGYPVPQGARGA